jgi:hypothetical protein
MSRLVDGAGATGMRKKLAPDVFAVPAPAAALVAGGRLVVSIAARPAVERGEASAVVEA